MPTEDSGSGNVARIGRTGETLRALQELADQLDDIARRAGASRWLGRSDGRVAAAAARHIRAIPEALAVSMREAFDVGRVRASRGRARGDRGGNQERLHSLGATGTGGGQPGNA
jgi:hypothetical protein